jgi:hypothetical protein
MSINQLNMVFAAGEIGLLLLILVFALVARWLNKRETAREIAALPVYQPKLHGLEGPVTRAAAQFAALPSDSENFHKAQLLVETASAEEHVETVNT